MIIYFIQGLSLVTRATEAILQNTAVALIFLMLLEIHVVYRF